METPRTPAPHMCPPRRDFLRASTLAAAGLAVQPLLGADDVKQPPPRTPLNVVFVFADQWRAQATGYAGDPNVHTPNLDVLAKRSIHFTRAIASCPVCSPYRASLITGQYPLTHGVFINDVHLRHEAVSIAEAFQAGGYDTGYIGKWHLQGRGRLSFIPPEDRQGFGFWRVCECTHAYNQSVYYGDGPERLTWPGYDAEAQTRCAQAYIRGQGRDKAKPFLLMLSWGPPHNPYETAPKQFRDLYDPARLVLRPHVPPPAQPAARRDLAGYYAHCTALDTYVGDLLKTLDEAGLAHDTLFVFTSDHGDMLGSQGQQRKQRPWDESVRVPFLLRCPALHGNQGREIAQPIAEADLMPTLLRLCGLDVPKTVEGLDLSSLIVGGTSPSRDNPVGGASASRDLPEGALIACYAPFGEWTRGGGGREYRGVRTARHTYVETREGPWLLYDNERDPHQLTNLVGRPDAAEVRAHLAAELKKLLAQRNDQFLSGWDYIAKWGHTVDKTGTAPTPP
ncbi:MAG TPA: sulfatase-like hydrolase/transferase [Planctomycetota bacterium]|nr:sulfatase-like hydrolase/transferase [Planctomycetota bacterium]